jgi:hypothetical protein
MEEFKSDLPELARLKLRGLTGDYAKTNAPRAASGRGRMLIDDCAMILNQRLQERSDPRSRGKKLCIIAARSRHYREQTLATLWRSWPKLREMDVRKVSLHDIENWTHRFATEYSTTRYKNTLNSLRAISQININRERGGLN